MSIIALGNMDDIKEPVLPPEGAYTLAVIKADHKQKDGKNSIQLILEIQDHDEENYAHLFSHIALPTEGDDEDKAQIKRLFLKRTLHWLGMLDALEDGSLDTDDLVGCMSTIVIPVVPDTYDNKPTRNVNWPNLPQEEAA